MPSSYWIVTLLSQSLIVPAIALWAHSAGLSRNRALGLGFGLAAWLATAGVLSYAGAFRPDNGRIPVIGIAILLPIVLGGFFLARGRLTLVRGPLAVLAALQVIRSVGFEFVTASYSGHVPAVFGIPAGWGDLAIGVTAPLVGIAMWRRVRGWRSIAIVWNVAGILDLVNAVSLGMVASPGLLQVLHTSPSTWQLTQLPLSLVPTFGVPLAVIGHMMGLSVLRKPTLAAA